MAVNLDKPQRWKEDIAQSVDMYNDWFLRFAPDTFRATRIKTTKDVETTLRSTGNLTNIRPETLRLHPQALSTLRMSTCPPLAVDRLVGLANVPKSMVDSMGEGKLPVRMSSAQLDFQLQKIGDIIERLADPDIFVWLKRNTPPIETEIHRAATIVADRLCGSEANPIIRNAQEKRQFALVGEWLIKRGYQLIPTGDRVKFNVMPSGSFSHRMNVPGRQQDNIREINIPMDIVIMPRTAEPGDMPLFFEAKSAGDFTNGNKRQKEEATKISQLRRVYGAQLRFNLFLCGYFNSGYLGYEAAEGIDWVWEHRIEDLTQFGI